MFSFWNKTETWPAKGLTILGLKRTFPFGESFQSIFRRRWKGKGRERGEKEEEDKERKKGKKKKLTNEMNSSYQDKMPRTAYWLPQVNLNSVIYCFAVLAFVAIPKSYLVCPVGHTCHATKLSKRTQNQYVSSFGSSQSWKGSNKKQRSFSPVVIFLLMEWLYSGFLGLRCSREAKQSANTRLCGAVLGLCRQILYHVSHQGSPKDTGMGCHASSRRSSQPRDRT